MARFAILVTICAAALTISSADEVQTGVQMVTKTLKGVCWYEFLKRLPDTEQRTEKFQNCFNNVDVTDILKQYEDQGFGGEKALPHLGDPIKQRTAMFLPDYASCDSYADDYKMAADKDHSSALEDKSDYPFRGYAHCILGKLEATRGSEAINDLKTRWTTKQNWIKVMNERENENRAQHGAKPLTVNAELTARAQKWADQLIAKCGELTRADHISKDHPDYKYNGEATGESIAQHGSKLSDVDSAYMAANGWYEEIRDYPWPEYKGDGGDALFGAIGHFTAQVWVGTKQVGYGIGKRDGCDKIYVVARYFPAGNMAGSFGKNVLSRQ